AELGGHALEPFGRPQHQRLRLDHAGPANQKQLIGPAVDGADTDALVTHLALAWPVIGELCVPPGVGRNRARSSAKFLAVAPRPASTTSRAAAPMRRRRSGSPSRSAAATASSAPSR